jgi:clan AA aspartic protease
MISGAVNEGLAAVVRLMVRGRQGQELGTEAVVDTGYNGSLTLPSSLIAELGLPFLRYSRAVLGDGRETVFEVYEAILLWNGQLRRVPIDSADTSPLLGMALLYGHDLTIQVIEGGAVSIREMLRA